MSGEFRTSKYLIIRFNGYKPIALQTD